MHSSCSPLFSLGAQPEGSKPKGRSTESGMEQRGHCKLASWQQHRNCIKGEKMFSRFLFNLTILYLILSFGIFSLFAASSFPFDSRMRQQKQCDDIAEPAGIGKTPQKTGSGKRETRQMWGKGNKGKWSKQGERESAALSTATRVDKNLAADLLIDGILPL